MNSTPYGTLPLTFVNRHLTVPVGAQLIYYHPTDDLALITLNGHKLLAVEGRYYPIDLDAGTTLLRRLSDSSFLTGQALSLARGHVTDMEEYVSQ